MSTKRARQSALLVEDFYKAGREIQNRSGRTSTQTNEDKLFREFFGCSAKVALFTWKTMEHIDFVPSGGKMEHLMWALFFLKQYPVEGVACGAVGASRGKVDPKTYRKWVKPFITAISDLEPFVVSSLLVYTLFLC